MERGEEVHYNFQNCGHRKVRSSQAGFKPRPCSTESRQPRGDDGKFVPVMEEILTDDELSDAAVPHGFHLIHCRSVHDQARCERVLDEWDYVRYGVIDEEAISFNHSDDGPYDDGQPLGTEDVVLDNHATVTAACLAEGEADEAYYGFEPFPGEFDYEEPYLAVGMSSQLVEEDDWEEVQEQVEAARMSFVGLCRKAGNGNIPRDAIECDGKRSGQRISKRYRAKNDIRSHCAQPLTPRQKNGMNPFRQIFDWEVAGDNRMTAEEWLDQMAEVNEQLAEMDMEAAIDQLEAQEERRQLELLDWYLSGYDIDDEDFFFKDEWFGLVFTEPAKSAAAA